jgi:A/G-specific adenine glycosylase
MREMKAAINARHAADFRRLLLRWFQTHKRDLPWRGETDPYRILVSEIMLQQTRVAVVEGRYKKFVARFPTVRHLARAKESAVLAAWSGLGYYRRARALHRAAKEIAGRGTFPATAVELMELPGVGRYTAAAVASIAFREAVPVVDGNVKRVIERLSADRFPINQKIREEQYWEIAGRLLDKENPGDFNQAMMELGALVCLPARPLCGACPVVALCALRGPAEKAARSARRKAVLHYALVRKNGRVLLRQRDAESSLMPGMWELPEIPPPAVKFSNPKLSTVTAQLKLRHSITTTDYTIFVHAVNKARLEGRWVPLGSADRLPLTGLARKIIQRLGDA